MKNTLTHHVRRSGVVLRVMPSGVVFAICEHHRMIQGPCTMRHAETFARLHEARHRHTEVMHAETVARLGESLTVTRCTDPASGAVVSISDSFDTDARGHRVTQPNRAAANATRRAVPVVNDPDPTPANGTPRPVDTRTVSDRVRDALADVFGGDA